MATTRTDGINLGRRRFLGTAAITATTAAQLALMRSAEAHWMQVPASTAPTTKPGSNTTHWCSWRSPRGSRRR